MSIAFTHNPNQPTILVVDDNPDNLNVTLRLLSEQPFEIAVAMDGASALESFRMTSPQLALLDIVLPDMSGFELCRRLKAESVNNEVPVIFMTAFNDAKFKLEAFEAGAADYLTKPFERLELLARIDHHWRIHQRTHNLETENHRLQQINHHLKLRNRIATEANQKLQQLVHVDGLTQVGNRRCFDERFQQEWLRLRREQKPLSLILFDIDYFKAYNDRYGHPAGDDCLVKIAQAIKRLLKRPGDLLTRYGGEEFAVILPNVEAAGALYVADHIQAEIARLELPHEASGVGPHVTVSQGISTGVPLVNLLPSHLIQSADQALYLAKQQGRDQSVHRSRMDSDHYSASPSSVKAPQSEGLE